MKAPSLYPGFKISMPPALPAWARTPPRDGPAYLLKLLEEDGTVEQFPISRKAGYLLGRNAKECDLAVDDKVH